MEHDQSSLHPLVKYSKYTNGIEPRPKRRQPQEAIKQS
jgi:hypothetical protein